MNVFQVFLIAFIGAAASITVKRTNPEIAMVISIATGVIVLYFSANNFFAVFNGIKDAFNKIGVSADYVKLMIKIVGITYIGEFAASALRDAGESAIASKIEIFAKVLIVAMAMPAFISFIGGAFEVLT